MDYIEITADTWTKVSDASTGLIIVQSTDPNNRAFFFSFGEPGGGEHGMYEKDTLILNSGTEGAELWIYTTEAVTVVVQGAV